MIEGSILWSNKKSISILLFVNDFTSLLKSISDRIKSFDQKDYIYRKYSIWCIWRHGFIWYESVIEIIVVLTAAENRWKKSSVNSTFITISTNDDTDVSLLLENLRVQKEYYDFKDKINFLIGRKTNSKHNVRYVTLCNSIRLSNFRNQRWLRKRFLPYFWPNYRCRIHEHYDREDHDVKCSRRDPDHLGNLIIFFSKWYWY